MQSALLDVVIVVTVAPRSPPSPIPSIGPMQTPDTPVDVLVVAAVVNVALSLLCPLPVAAGGTQPLCQLTHRHHLLSWKCRRFRCRPKLVLMTCLPVFPTRRPDTANVSATSCDVGFFFAVSYVLSLPNCHCSNYYNVPYHIHTLCSLFVLLFVMSSLAPSVMF
jgi:hypothetical protein